MIGLMDKGGANSTQPQNGLASAFLNNTATPTQSVPQISMPAINFGTSPAFRAPGMTPEQAATLTAARIQARAPVVVAPTVPAGFAGDNQQRVQTGIRGRDWSR